MLVCVVVYPLIPFLVNYDFSFLVIGIVAILLLKMIYGWLAWYHSMRIELFRDGKILYRGKPINKYYIEGLNLLEGKYNLANSNLPHKEVAKVQVLDNHQPIRVLDSLVYSNQAAINIKLKNSYTFTRQAELGLGLLPLLWYTNFAPMAVF
ncbi:MAG: hypothetical protein ACK5H1_01570 [Tenacibaculum sp.]